MAPSDIRDAQPKDIDRLAEFEVDIAVISFGDEAVTDPSQHKKKLQRAMEKGGDIMLVLDDGDDVAGWLWISINTNMLTSERYANFRSFALAPSARGQKNGRRLLEAGLARVKDAGGVSRVVGKVHVDNVPMRLLYREMGFRPQHLTMELRI